MLSGRFPILVILVLGLVVAATKGVPWMLKQFREPTPPILVTDLRNARYVEPYGKWPKPGEEQPMTVSVHGPALSAVYSATHKVEEIPFEVQEADEVIIASGDEMVTLPDGQTISLAAIAIVPTRGSINPVNGDKRMGGFYHPSGRWMDPEEQEALIERLGTDGNKILMNSVNTGHAWTLQFLLETDWRKTEIAGVTLRDELTGGQESRISDYLFPSWHTYEEFRLESFTWSGVRPSPMALHVFVETKDHLELGFEPLAPQSLKWGEMQFELRSVHFQEGRDATPIVVSGDPNDASLVPTMSSASTTLVFDSLPADVGGIRANTRDGSIARARWTGGNMVSIPADLHDIERVVLVVPPRVVQVAIRLPELPGVPAANRELKDVRDMIIPPTVIEDQKQLDQFIQSILQVSYFNAKQAEVTPTPFPRDVGGLTVREILHSELERYPEHGIQLKVSPGMNPVMVVTSTGVGRMIHDPPMHLAINILSNVWILIGIPLVSLAPWKIWVLLRAHDLHRLLRARGYTDWTIWDAERAYIGLGKRAWNIPSMDELGAIPGVDATDVRSVVNFLANLEKEE